jgi:hypothetical protein
MTSEGAGETSNTINDGAFNAPLVQARDVFNPTFITGQAARRQ